jgi:hypothetical protein
MEYFAEPMYAHGKNQVIFNPDIFADRVNDLINRDGEKKS